jgi:hypothetical protein
MMNMNVEIRPDVGLDRVQESVEFARPMTGGATPDDFSCGRVEGGEQRGRAVTGIMMAAPFGLARTHWGAKGWGSEGWQRSSAWIWLFSSTHGAIALWRSQGQPDDIAHLLDEQRVS